MQRKNNFFQKPKHSKHELKSTRASEATGNEFFVKPSPSDSRQTSNAIKKPFDKKSWRLQQYSKKYKLDQWENRRKKSVLRDYYRQIDPNEKKLDVQRIYQQYDDNNTDITSEEADNDNNVNVDSIQTPTAVDDDVSNKITNINVDTVVAYNKVANNETTATGKRKNAFQKARDEFARMKEQKRFKKEEFLKKKQEKVEKIKLYQQKKAEKFKRLNKKTKRGQPVMKDRMEMLLEQIQNNM